MPLLGAPSVWEASVPLRRWTWTWPDLEPPPPNSWGTSCSSTHTSFQGSSDEWNVPIHAESKVALPVAKPPPAGSRGAGSPSPSGELGEGDHKAMGVPGETPITKTPEQGTPPTMPGQKPVSQGGMPATVEGDAEKQKESQLLDSEKELQKFKASPDNALNPVVVQAGAGQQPPPGKGTGKGVGQEAEQAHGEEGHQGKEEKGHKGKGEGNKEHEGKKHEGKHEEKGEKGKHGEHEKHEKGKKHEGEHGKEHKDEHHKEEKGKHGEHKGGEEGKPHEGGEKHEEGKKHEHGEEHKDHKHEGGHGEEAQQPGEQGMAAGEQQQALGEQAQPSGAEPAAPPPAVPPPAEEEQPEPPPNDLAAQLEHKSRMEMDESLKRMQDALKESHERPGMIIEMPPGASVAPGGPVVVSQGAPSPAALRHLRRVVDKLEEAAERLRGAHRGIWATGFEVSAPTASGPGRPIGGGLRHWGSSPYSAPRPGTVAAAALPLGCAAHLPLQAHLLAARRSLPAKEAQWRLFLTC